jgi:hypothetical protein
MTVEVLLHSFSNFSTRWRGVITQTLPSPKQGGARSVHWSAGSSLGVTMTSNSSLSDSNGILAVQPATSQFLWLNYTQLSNSVSVPGTGRIFFPSPIGYAQTGSGVDPGSYSTGTAKGIKPITELHWVPWLGMGGAIPPYYNIRSCSAWGQSYF